VQQNKIIQCGSRSLSPAKSRYAVIELEALALAWAMLECRHCLIARHFQAITDHRPLVGIFAKPLNVEPGHQSSIIVI